MSEENVETVQELVGHWSRGEFWDAAPFDKHATLVVSRDFPEWGVFTGLEAIGGYMRRFLDQWEHWRVELQDIQTSGDTVLTRLMQRGTFRATGIESELDSYTVFTFRAGKIIRMDSFRDEVQALEAAGLSD